MHDSTCPSPPRPTSGQTRRVSVRQSPPGVAKVRREMVGRRASTRQSRANVASRRPSPATHFYLSNADWRCCSGEACCNPAPTSPAKAHRLAASTPPGLAPGQARVVIDSASASDGCFLLPHPAPWKTPLRQVVSVPGCCTFQSTPLAESSRRLRRRCSRPGACVPCATPARAGAVHLPWTAEECKMQSPLHRMEGRRPVRWRGAVRCRRASHASREKPHSVLLVAHATCVVPAARGKHRAMQLHFRIHPQNGS